MRTSQKADRSRLIKAALQQIPCDLTIENVEFVNVFTGEVYPASVDILDGTVVRVRESGEDSSIGAKSVYDGKGAYLIPGFIDTHVHVESTMMIPQNLSRAIVPWGTTTVCTDPHEIANVMGVAGVKFMLADGKQSALRHYVLAPSCVPSVPGMESTGAELHADEVGEILDLDDCVGVAEIMDFVNVINDEHRMHTIIEEGVQRHSYLQGHAPLLTGKELVAYILAGPRSDHESQKASEVAEKLRNGMHVNLRASSLIDDLNVLLKGFEGHKWKDFASFCTDDVHAKDLLEEGHINRVVAKAIAAGLDPIEMIKLATLNAAREYGFDDLGAVAPGYLADMQLVRSLDMKARPEAVFIQGQLVAENGKYLGTDVLDEVPEFPNTVDIPQIGSADDFRLKAPNEAEDEVMVAVLVPQELAVFNRIEWMKLPVKDGYVDLDGRNDLCFAAVINRYGNGKKTIAVMKDRGVKEGAYGSTISHDSHNLTILYKNFGDAYLVAKTLEDAGGGICVARAGELLATLELPVAGLMSVLPVEALSVEIDKTEKAVQAVCGEGTSLLVAAIIALACLPCIVLSDFGIVDGLNQQLIDGLKLVEK